MSIVVQDLVKIYGEQRAVDHISFEAKPGQVLGFLGPNGAGKSTTMKIATGYVPPTQGTVFIKGLDVRQYPLKTKRSIGYLPEHNPLYTDQYVHEYLRFSGKMYLPTRELKPRIAEIIELCGLQLEQNKKIGSLSKGYRQRVGLASALLHQPEVLILDEPTTGLDPNQIMEIRKLLKQVSERKTVVLSTHIMQEVQALCDHVVIINRGKIVANEPTSALTQSVSDRKQLEVEFEEEVPHDSLRNIDGVLNVEKISGSKLLIEYNSEMDIRPSIYHYATEHKLTLLGLSVKSTSLEDIFRQLTQKQDG